MQQPTELPKTAAELRLAIVEKYESLSKRLKLVARHALDHPDDFALQTLAVIAERSKTQPSTIVRFAQTFGFTGASSLQRLFRERLVSNHVSLSYGERVRNFNSEVAGRQARGAAVLLDECVEGSVLALQNLPQTISARDLERAIRMVTDADTVFVAAFRRAFPVSSYLAYALQQAGKRAILIDGIAALGAHQAKAVRPSDLLIAVSFHPYAAETVELVKIASGAKAPVLAITDSAVSPIAKLSRHVLLVREIEVRTFRSIAGSMCVAQALLMGYLFAKQRAAGPLKRPRNVRPRRARK
jgi:DNA-binding MurR/RpiR family transcriptional regulator